MEIDPPVTDLLEGDSTDSEYADVDDGGAMLVEDLEDERENMAPPPPPIIRVATPHPVTNSPSWPCLWPSTFFFRSKFT
jgi:hypothetical protein